MGSPADTLQWVSPIEHPLHLGSQMRISDLRWACLPLQYEESQWPGVKSMTTPNAYSVLVVHRLNAGHLGYHTQFHLAPLQCNNSRSHWCFPCFSQLWTAPTYQIGPTVEEACHERGWAPAEGR